MSNPTKFESIVGKVVAATAVKHIKRFGYSSAVYRKHCHGDCDNCHQEGTFCADTDCADYLFNYDSEESRDIYEFRNRLLTRSKESDVVFGGPKFDRNRNVITVQSFFGDNVDFLVRNPYSCYCTNKNEKKIFNKYILYPRKRIRTSSWEKDVFAPYAFVTPQTIGNGESRKSIDAYSSMISLLSTYDLDRISDHIVKEKDFRYVKGITKSDIVDMIKKTDSYRSLDYAIDKLYDMLKDMNLDSPIEQITNFTGMNLKPYWTYPNREMPSKFTISNIRGFLNHIERFGESWSLKVYRVADGEKPMERLFENYCCAFNLKRVMHPEKLIAHPLVVSGAMLFSVESKYTLTRLIDQLDTVNEYLIECLTEICEKKEREARRNIDSYVSSCDRPCYSRYYSDCDIPSIYGDNRISSGLTYRYGKTNIMSSTIGEVHRTIMKHNLKDIITYEPKLGENLISCSDDVVVRAYSYLQSSIELVWIKLLGLLNFLEENEITFESKVIRSYIEAPIRIYLSVGNLYLFHKQRINTIKVIKDERDKILNIANYVNSNSEYYKDLDSKIMSEILEYKPTSIFAFHYEEKEDVRISFRDIDIKYIRKDKKRFEDYVSRKDEEALFNLLRLNGKPIDKEDIIRGRP